MIYECLLERAYEGILQTYCTKDKESAIEWLKRISGPTKYLKIN